MSVSMRMQHTGLFLQGSQNKSAVKRPLQGIQSNASPQKYYLAENAQGLCSPGLISKDWGLDFAASVCFLSDEKSSALHSPMPQLPEFSVPNLVVISH